MPRNWVPRRSISTLFPSLLSLFLHLSPKMKGKGGHDSLTGIPDLCLDGLGIDLDAPGGKLDSNR